jgi:hypothetical protein
MAWRNSHPATNKFWGDINRAAIKAVQNPGKVFAVNPRIDFRVADDFLLMRLPSGRELAYPFPRLALTDREDFTIVYKDASSGKWADWKTPCKPLPVTCLRPQCRALKRLATLSFCTFTMKSWPRFPRTSAASTNSR